MWCPPTPPQQDNDVYIDQNISFLYDVNVMSESQLPPIYIKREAKRNRIEAGLVDSRRPLKIPRKDEVTNAPKSLFHSPTVLKMRRDLKLQKYRGLVRPPIALPGKSNIPKAAIEQPLFHEWTINEDMALLKVIQNFQGIPLNLLVMNPGHTPNWDFVSDYVNTVSIVYRSPKQCRQRYEMVLMQREEGKHLSLDNTFKKKKNKLGALQKYPMSTKSNRPMRTSQLYSQDNNASFGQLLVDRFESLKSIANKKSPANRPFVNHQPKTKSASVLNECGIDLDQPILPVEVAARRAERIAKEKKTATPENATRIHLRANSLPTQQLVVPSTQTVSTIVSSAPTPALVSTGPQIAITQSPAIATTATITISNPPGTPPSKFARKFITYIY